MGIVYKLRAISISRRLYLLGITITVLSLIPLLLFASNYQSSMLEQKRLKTRHLVESAHSLFTYYYQQEQQGILSRADAQLQAKQAIASLRYEGKKTIFGSMIWLKEWSCTLSSHR